MLAIVNGVVYVVPKETTLDDLHQHLPFELDPLDIIHFVEGCQITEVAIWSRALTSDEITSLYSNKCDCLDIFLHGCQNKSHV